MAFPRRSRVSALRLAVGAAFAAPGFAFAQSAGPSAASAPASAGATTELDAVIVTGSPIRASRLFDFIAPASTLQGRGLVLRRGTTVGDTINDMPGVSSSYFGPNASRPVIRGLDGERVRIMSNGMGSLDASALSFDHALPVDPATADRVEVVRGAAALLYGGNAVGGVVNVIDNRIPQDARNGVSGSIEPRVGGADRLRSNAVVLEGGNGRFALHADVYSRQTENLDIPGGAVSGRLRQAIAQNRQGFAAQAHSLAANGRLPNSRSSADGGALGASLTWDKGYAGMSYRGFNSTYGTVAEPRVSIDMQSGRWDFAGEVREVSSLVEAVKFKYARTDYAHREIDNGVAGTTFRNKGNEGRVEAVHGKLGPLTGAFGFQYGGGTFEAQGAEAFVPSTRSDAKALFLYEEMTVGALKLSAGARTERNELKSVGGGTVDASTGAARFGAAQTRSFSPRSGTLGGLYAFTPGVALAANYSLTERAPSAGELFANGRHVATGEYEVGNTGFGKEKSRSLDLGLRMRSGGHSGSVGAYYTRFSNYIALFRSGNNRGSDGELNPVDADGDGNADGSGNPINPETQFRAVRAVFKGIEAQGRFQLMDAGTKLHLLLGLDIVRAENADTGAPLPRIAPARLKAGLEYARNAWGARAEVVRVSAQNRVTANELPTDAYTLLNASVSYRFKAFAGTTWDAFLRGDNLTNREARNHASSLKDIAPLPGRGIMAGLRGEF